LIVQLIIFQSCLLIKKNEFFTGTDEEMELLFKISETNEKIISNLKEIDKFELPDNAKEVIRNLKKKCTMVLRKLDVSRKTLEEYRENK